MQNGEITLIKDIKPGLKNINAIFIVLDIGASTVTKENREVRNFKVGDPTACINVSIWDEPGKIIALGDIIKLTKGYASIWRHCLTLYSGKNGEVYKIGEFCMTFNEQLNMSEPKQQIPTQGIGVTASVVQQPGGGCVTLPLGGAAQIVQTMPTVVAGTNAASVTTKTQNHTTQLGGTAVAQTTTATTTKAGRGGRANATRNNLKADRRQ